MNPTVRTLLAVVVVGSGTPDATNDAPHVIARAVPLSLIRIINLSKLFGVPVKFVVIDVIAAACAVMVTASQVSVLIVGVPDDVIDVTRGTNRAPPPELIDASTVLDEFCHS